MELIDRSLVQISRTTSNAGIKTCTVHKLVHELALSKAVDYNFFSIDDQPDINPYVDRCVCYCRNLDRVPASATSFSHLRSFLCINNETLAQQQLQIGGGPVPEGLPHLLEMHQLLRLLDLEGIAMRELPDEVGKMFYLRHLGLRRTNVKGLPPSARNLRNLRTLDVKFTCVNSIPDAIQAMPKLEHLYLNRDVQTGNSQVIKRLTNIQTISMVGAEEWMEQGLENLKELRKLGIRGHLSFFHNESSSLTKLKSLRVGLGFGNGALNWASLPCSLTKLHLERHLGKPLPRSEEFPQNVVKLCLRWSFMEKGDDIAALQSFQNLKVLVLGCGSFIGKEMILTSGGFSNLEFLKLDQLNDLEEWRVEEEALPTLAGLAIRSCRRLKNVPKGLQHVTTLRKLEISLMPQEFKAQLDWDKVMHIPSVSIGRAHL